MELLTQQGWQMYYRCFCGGSLKEHWENKSYPGYELRVRPTKNTFTIISQNRVIYGPDYLYNLEKKLKEYGIYHEAVQTF